MPLISVIVPARDVVEYIAPCLDDLRRQRFGDLEVLVVDDGSVDGTTDVIDQVTADDRRFRRLDSHGRGPSVARNEGLAAATGELLAFVDADDRISPRYLEAMLEAMRASGSDLVSCNVRRLVGFETRTSGLHNQAISGSASGTHLAVAPELVYDTTVWNKLIRRELWDRTGLRFPEGRWINDIFPSLRTHVAAGAIDVLADVLYYWRVRTDRGESITGSKFTDPEARRKSLEDRFAALGASHELLEAHLGTGAVLDEFHRRVLWHDLRAYLSIVPDADDGYARELRERTCEFLRRHGIDPSRHRLGRLLDEVYVAVLDGDTELMRHLLDPTVEVAATSRDGRFATVLRGPAHLRRRRSLLAPLRRTVGGPQPLTSDPDVTIRVQQVELDPRARGPLEAIGTIRIAEGRDDLFGPWTLVPRWCGVDTGALVPVRPLPLPEPPAGEAHPLMRAGWRPFRLTADLEALGDHPEETRWRLDLVVAAADGHLTTPATLTTAAVRGLGHGRPIAPDADLVPVPGRRSVLHLQREAVAARLEGARADPDGHMRFQLRLAGPPVGEEVSVWLQEPDGTLVAEADVAPGDDHDRCRAILAPPATAMTAATRWELWCRTTAGTHRVRVDPLLRATSWPDVTTADEVLTGLVRATVRGRAVVVAATHHLEVDHLDATELGGTWHVRVAGRSLTSSAPPVLEAHCRWTGERVRTAVEHHEDGWSARFPLGVLTGEIAGQPAPRPWSLHQVDDAGVRQVVGVPAERRHRFPLTGTAGTYALEVSVAAASAARLRVAPT